MYKESTVSTLLCSAVLLIGAQAAQAEPVACKGMEQPSCIDASSCRWVNTYQRSDGRKIRGYCRKLPSQNVKDVSSRQEPEDSNPQKS